jgi:NAD(P)-dependent dehydrogenase (short-subunit alcohol dehydrogenase family)
VVVTGGASGIGLALVHRLLGRGVRLTVLDADDAALQALETAPDLHVQRVDVRDEAAIDAAFQQATRRAGVPRGLVCAAGTRSRGLPALDTSVDDWRRTIDVHLLGTLIACRSFARQLLDEPCLAAERGSIITVSSIVGLAGFTNQCDYGPAKAAVINLTKVLALEWAPMGIRVNAVAPGFTRTPMVDSLVAEGYDLGGVERRTPLGRLADPNETALVIDLLLREATFVTGTVLPVDGGWSASGR